MLDTNNNSKIKNISSSSNKGNENSPLPQAKQANTEENKSKIESNVKTITRSNIVSKAVAQKNKAQENKTTSSKTVTSVLSTSQKK